VVKNPKPNIHAGFQRVGIRKVQHQSDTQGPTVSPTLTSHMTAEVARRYGSCDGHHQKGARPYSIGGGSL